MTNKIKTKFVCNNHKKGLRNHGGTVIFIRLQHFNYTKYSDQVWNLHVMSKDWIPQQNDLNIKAIVRNISYSK